MTTARGIMAEAARRGVMVVVKGDWLNWTAPAGAVTPGLIEAMKAHKAEILTALRQADKLSEQRYGVPPPGELPMILVPSALSFEDGELLADFFTRQPAPVLKWILDQADRFTATAPHWPPSVWEVAAMVDCLLWQWEAVLTTTGGSFDRIMEATQKLRDLEGAAKDAKCFFEQEEPAREHRPRMPDR